jgi:predicted DNA-binding transcriptional regulator AlpA
VGNSETSDTQLLADYLRKDDLAREFGVSARTIERWVRLRILPQPVRLGRTSLYHLPTVRQHLQDSLYAEKSKRHQKR